MKFDIIQKTPLYNAFSDIGKRIFLPEGIFYWSGRAKKEAELIGTIGTAYGFESDFIDGGESDWLPCYLKEIKEYSGLSVKQIVPYASIGGLLEIRKIWKKWIIRKSIYNDKDKASISRLNKYLTTPVITGGITNGIFQCCSLFLNPNEYIIVPNKRWGNYDNIIYKFIGAKTQSFEFFKDSEMNIKGLKTAIEKIANIQEKVVLLLNFPNNPTGQVYSEESLKELGTLLREKGKTLNRTLYVISDEPYRKIIYDGYTSPSIFNCYDESIIVTSYSKDISIPGERIGFAAVNLRSVETLNSDTTVF